MPTAFIRLYLQAAQDINSLKVGFLVFFLRSIQIKVMSLICLLKMLIQTNSFSKYRTNEFKKKILKYILNIYWNLLSEAYNNNKTTTTLHRNTRYGRQFWSPQLPTSRKTKDTALARGLHSWRQQLILHFKIQL